MKLRDQLSRLFYSNSELNKMALKIQASVKEVSGILEKTNKDSEHKNGDGAQNAKNTK